WTNTWMAADEASWINDTDQAALRARPAAFQQLLGQVSPAALRDALLGIIDDARHHLQSYPASCAARARREDAFEQLYDVMGDSFGRTRAQVDTDYRLLEDYVFAELEYATSKTCCWNKSTSAMYQIAMDYNRSLLESSCQEPVVFKCQGGGYQVFANYAAQTGRAHLWKPWSEDESCPQRNVAEDTEADSQSIGWCSVVANGGGESACADDAFEDNDAPGTAKSLASGTHAGLAVCCGDDDYYRVTVPSGVAVSISFDHDAGDLDLEIYSGSTLVDTSDSVSDAESVLASGGGTYVVRVLGYNGAAGAYSLTVTPQ
ncbi:MAG TPA: PPC domain-containing protein, partial [Polyangiaceae bacterium]|nr:PPC domain-containing protein [Polyangiaceae bacterium]